jgi:GNAT superfamily N-acetyltransferase
MTRLAIHPLTPDRWDDFVALFETDSICRGCWCIHHRLPVAVLKGADRSVRKSMMRKIVKSGPPPGLLAYRDGEAIAWLALTPRPATPDWNTGRKASAAFAPEDAEDPKTWAASCFFIRKDARGQGVTAALLKAGIEWAKGEGARRIDACPMAHDEKRSPIGLFVGPKRVFERAGFATLIERKPGRPLMRLELGKAALKRTSEKKPIAKKPASAKKAAKPKARAR